MDSEIEKRLIAEAQNDPKSYYKRYNLDKYHVQTSMRYICFIMAIGHGNLTITRAHTRIQEWAYKEGLLDELPTE